MSSAAALERVSERGRHLLSVAAVIGRAFDFALLRHGGARDEHATPQGVEELVRRRLLTGLATLDVTHDRIREVVYGALLPWHRARLHCRIAETIEALQADRLPDFWEALADHWQRGEAGSRAVHYHLSVAERARRRYAYATARALVPRRGRGRPRKPATPGPESTASAGAVGAVREPQGRP